MNCALVGVPACLRAYMNIWIDWVLSPLRESNMLNPDSIEAELSYVVVELVLEIVFVEKKLQVEKA